MYCNVVWPVVTAVNGSFSGVTDVVAHSVRCISGALDRVPPAQLTAHLSAQPFMHMAGEEFSFRNLVARSPGTGRGIS